MSVPGYRHVCRVLDANQVSLRRHRIPPALQEYLVATEEIITARPSEIAQHLGGRDLKPKLTIFGVYLGERAIGAAFARPPYSIRSAFLASRSAKPRGGLFENRPDGTGRRSGRRN
jgi:hypothetical protein